MALQTTGSISLQDIANEFGGTLPHSLSEYYAGGGLVPAGASGVNGAIPSSGAISLSNFYGAANYTLVQTLNNPTPAEFDFFGSAVAMSANYLIVGAPGDNADVGAAYIYSRTVANWSLQATLPNPPGLQAGEGFGKAVAMTDNYAIVGSSVFEKVYIYGRSGTTWNLQASLSGFSKKIFADVLVAISDNYAIVGSCGDDTGASDAGAAFIYARSGTTWSLQATLNNPTPETGDGFGFSVSITDNYAVVGEVKAYVDGNEFSSTYVYLRTGTTWDLQATIQSPDPVVNTAFGGSFVSHTDNYLLVVNENARYSYIYERTGTTWTLVRRIGDGSQFSSNDGRGENAKISDNYAIFGKFFTFIYHRSGGTWSLVAKILDPTSLSVSIAETDSGVFALLGDDSDDTGASNVGSAFIYQL